MVCTRCNGTGFLNLHQVPDSVLDQFYVGDGNLNHQVIIDWMTKNPNGNDVSICNCCGNTEQWFGTAGEHNERDFGLSGPYFYNGGLPECY